MYKYFWIIFVLLSSYRSYSSACSDTMGRSSSKISPIRSMDNEQNLRAQGFSRYYTNQFDTAVQLVELRKHWIAKKVDPESTHIPYFSQKAVSHIEAVRKDIEASELPNSEKYDRLRMLKKLKEDALFMRKTYKVTFIWWNIFNIRLMALTAPDIPSAFNLGLSQYDLLNHRTVYERLEETQDLIGTFGAEYMQMMNKFPDIVLVPIVGNVGLMAFNQTVGENVHFLRISNAETADGGELTPQILFRYDLQRVASMENYLETQDSSFHSWFKLRMKSFSKKERAQQELAYYLLMFERGNMKGNDDAILQRNFHRLLRPTPLVNFLPADIRNRSYEDTEQYQQALREHFDNMNSDFSQLRETAAN